MRILITGATGFAGGHLTEALLSRGEVEIFGIGRRPSWPDELQHLSGRVALHACDLCQATPIEALVRLVRPERIFHLAGYANPRQSFREAEAAWSGNLTASRNLYEAIVRWGGRPRVLFVGSGLVYGDPPAADRDYGEESPLKPASPYAASKAAADLASYQYTRFPGLEIVRVRPFNHIGPRQSVQYAVAHFAQQVAAIEKGRQPPLLETGNLDARRDLTDVRDMVQAYLLLMEHGRSGEVYNAASDQIYSMQEVLDRLLALAQVKVAVRQKAELLAAGDLATVRGHAGKLRDATGWQPRYTLDQTLADTLEYWRKVGYQGF